MNNDIRAALERLLNAVDGPRYDAFESQAAIAAARAALAAEPVGEGPSLRWTENMPPSEDCRYDHCTAETPFGRFLISWKGWKQFDSPTVDETPWGDWYGAFNSVDAAKAACQKEIDDRIACWGHPAAPPAPEVGELWALAAALRDPCIAPLLSERTRAATLLQQQAAPAPVVVPLTAAQLQSLKDHLWTVQDDGPPGEGWASRRVEELRDIVDGWAPLPQFGEGQL